MSPQRVIELFCFGLFVIASFMPAMRAPIIGGISLVDDPVTAVVVVLLSVLGIYGVVSDSSNFVNSGRRGIVTLVVLQFLTVTFNKAAAEAKASSIENEIVKSGAMLILKATGFGWGFSILIIIAVALLFSEIAAINLFQDEDAARARRYRKIHRQQQSISPIWLIAGLCLMIAVSLGSTVFKEQVDEVYGKLMRASIQVRIIRSPTYACTQKRLGGSTNTEWKYGASIGGVYYCGDTVFRKVKLDTSDKIVDLLARYEGSQGKVNRKVVIVAVPEGANAFEGLYPHLKPMISKKTKGELNNLKIDDKGHLVSDNGHDISIGRVREVGPNAWAMIVNYAAEIQVE